MTNGPEDLEEATVMLTSTIITTKTSLHLRNGRVITALEAQGILVSPALFQAFHKACLGQTAIRIMAPTAR